MTYFQRRLIRQNMGLTRKQADELQRQGYALKFIALGCGDKDFYDIYL